MGRQRLPSLNARIRMKRSQLGLAGAELARRAGISASSSRRSPAHPSALELASTAAAAHATAAGPDVLRIPVLVPGADPGKLAPSPLAVQDRLVVDRRLVVDHAPERLFAYDVTLPAMKHLRGLASPGDRIVFQRGGRVSADRICAVRTPDGIVLARVLFKGRSLLLLPGESERVKALPGVIAGTHVLLLRR
jgi:transcriptional regulator with XRE-family HTH domain